MRAKENVTLFHGESSKKSSRIPINAKKILEPRFVCGGGRWDLNLRRGVVLSQMAKMALASIFIVFMVRFVAVTSFIIKIAPILEIEKGTVNSLEDEKMVLRNRKHLGDLEATIKWRIVDKICPRYLRSRIKNKDFSIISDNCIVIGIYHKLGLRYSTPTVGVSFFAEDYIKLLENFESLIKQPLKFKKISNHQFANEVRKKIPYPIGVLNDDVEIQFQHYKTEEEAANKWNRRTKRINFNNLFFLFTDQGEFQESYLDRYEKLPFEHKIFLSSKPRENHDSVVFVRDYENNQMVGDSTRNRKYEKYIDIIKWLNGEKHFLES